MNRTDFLLALPRAGKESFQVYFSDLDKELSALGHKYGDVFYAAILYSCSRAESLASRFLRSSRVNFHSKGLAVLS